MEHYDAIDRRLGDRFEGADDTSFAVLGEHPEIARFFDGREPVRRLTLQSFPYGIFYEYREEQGRVDVLRVLHEARSPRQWPSPSG